MQKYKVKIEPEVLSDIKEIVDWHNKQQSGLGKRFQQTASGKLIPLTKTLKSTPFVTRKSVVF